MTKQEALQIAADQYRQEGYSVQVRPGPGAIPAFLRRCDVDLLAQKDQENVIVQVKKRDELYDLNQVADPIPQTPGWSFDLVVVPGMGPKMPAA